MKILLASKSPRRRQLVAALDLPMETIDIAVNESVDGDVCVERIAEMLARRKADACLAERIGDGDLLVTADTIVAVDGRKLGKPKDKEEATAMLRSLSGRTHTVFTGVCLRNDKATHSFTEATKVRFRHLSDEEIDYYVERYKPYDKAGAYGIQEWIGMVGIEGIEGDYYNVMGFPSARFYTEMKRFMSEQAPRN